MPKETKNERSIAERAKLTRQRLDEVKKEKKTYIMICFVITLTIQVQIICVAY